MKLFIMLTTLLFCISHVYANPSVTPKVVKPVVKAAKVQKNDTLIAEAKVFAKKWLTLIDQSKYNATWDQSSPTVQKLLTKEAWTKQLTTVLQPLGKLKSRTLKSASFHTQLPGTPDGQYVVIQFTSVFENKKTSVETLTPQKLNGTWVIAGYYIK